MTAWQYLEVLRRRWWLLMGLLALTAAGVWMLPAHAGVYWTRTSIVFLPPAGSAKVGNVLEGSDPSLIYFAAAVERATNGGAQAPRLSSPEATLYGTGVRQGRSVSLVDTGGQWRSNFNRPMLTVEVVDTSEARAREVASTLMAQIQGRAAALQHQAGAAPRSMIRTEPSPETPVITYVGGHHGRAAAAVLLLGTGISLVTTVQLDRLLRGRRRRGARLAAV
jgi:hypothetical protein